MRRAVYAGTFDPLTIGHMDIIRRSLELFDEVVVLVAENTHKNTIFSTQERKEMITEALREFPNIKVDTFNGLTVDYAKENNIKFIIRGLRAVQDYENELVMTYANRFLDPEIEMVYFMASAQYSFISSSSVREIAVFSDRYKELVPSNIAEKYENKLRRK